MEFKVFRDQVVNQFTNMTKGKSRIFLTEVDREKLYNTYLESFPEGEIRQSYNCNCCRQFLKWYGNIVVINDDLTISSIWDFVPKSDKFAKVCENLSNLVKSSKIRDVLVTSLTKVGTISNKAILENGSSIVWDHLYLPIPNAFVSRSSNSEATIMGQFRDRKNVFKRSLDEISMSTVDLVLELIDQGSIYRGSEFKSMIKKFKGYKLEYDKLPDDKKDNYAWKISSEDQSTYSSATVIRNTAIGTLLVDIESGMELDQAVDSFGRKMDPINYKRPKAIATKKMISDAEKTVAELGLMDSLPHRHASINDITVNNVIFVNRSSKNLSQSSNMFESLKEDADTKVDMKKLKSVAEMGIEDFINKILPTATNIEILYENRLMPNLMTLTAPVNPDSPSIFKWNNNFGWTYNGGAADSIKQKVKAAGGNINGVLRCSLHWFNYDDLDIHVIEPNGNEIYFSSKKSTTSGQLDIDMNAGSGQSRDAVENIVWTDESKMGCGTYKLIVHNYCKREKIDVGFECEIECNGEIHHFSYDKEVRGGQKVTVAEFDWNPVNGVQILSSIGDSMTSKSTTEWGLETCRFQNVPVIMYSPNYWDGQIGIGNKHYFFIMEGCKNPEEVRGFYNEFLKSDLDKHRRVFELLGSKSKVPYSDDQMSGLGFSSTIHNEIYVRVKGSFDRIIKVKI